MGYEMDAQVFWSIIGTYNKSTWIVQIFLLIALALSVFIAYRQKAVFLPKLILGITNLFIGICFIGFYGTEPIQKYSYSALAGYSCQASLRKELIETKGLSIVLACPSCTFCQNGIERWQVFRGTQQARFNTNSEKVSIKMLMNKKALSPTDRYLTIADMALATLVPYICNYNVIYFVYVWWGSCTT